MMFVTALQWSTQSKSMQKEQAIHMAINIEQFESMKTNEQQSFHYEILNEKRDCK